LEALEKMANGIQDAISRPNLEMVESLAVILMVWREKIHLKWWDARIDSPKYVDGLDYSITVRLDNKCFKIDLIMFDY